MFELTPVSLAGVALRASWLPHPPIDSTIPNSGAAAFLTLNGTI
jgi:hypothetical protein